MKKFRIFRGVHPQTGKAWGIGSTVNAPTLQEALKKENDENLACCRQTYGGLINPSKQVPVSKVYEMIEVPEEQWKK